MLESVFNPAMLNPNALYFLFVLGLWVGITALYIPGTGIAEIIGLSLIIISLIAFAIFPVNWIAVALIAIGVSAFLILPFLSPARAKYAEAGLILQAAGGFFLFETSRVSPLIIVALVMIALIYHRLILMPIMATQKEAPEELDVVGMRGRVVRAIDRLGTAQVNGELWTARSDVYLPPDTEIIVTRQNGLELTVEKAKREAS